MLAARSVTEDGTSQTEQSTTVPPLNQSCIVVDKIRNEKCTTITIKVVKSGSK